MPVRTAARDLNGRWNVGARHSLYNKDGKWYHTLNEFPGALFDKNGYILFDSRREHEAHSELRHYPKTNTLAVPRGLANINGYITFSADLYISPSESETLHRSERVLWEGGKTTVAVNRYERDRNARQACIDEFGSVCSVCGFDFSKWYGAIGQGYIHLHHLKPLSMAQGERYKINPREDLRPVCPNCHEMLHTKEPPLKIDQLKAIMLLLQQGAAGESER